MNFLNNLFTDGGNSQYDYAKIFGLFGILMYLVISFYSYGIKDEHFMPMDWATGFTVILAAAAGVSKIKDMSGPKS